MSRSFKKPLYVDGSKKFGKKFASRRVRKYNNLPSGSAYKKAYESWNISDFYYSGVDSDFVTWDLKPYKRSEIKRRKAKSPFRDEFDWKAFVK